MTCVHKAVTYFATASLAETAGGVTAERDLEPFLSQYRPKILRFLTASVRNLETAENLTQDCLLKAFKSYGQFRHECSLNTWLMQIAVSVLRDHMRNRRMKFWKVVERDSRPVELVGDFISDKGLSPEASAEVRQQLAAVWKVVAELSSRQRTVFLLRFVEDLDLLQIAAATGMKEGTVKVHLFRALQQVRKRVGIEK